MKHMPKLYFSRTVLSLWFEGHTRAFIVVGVAKETSEEQREKN